MSVSLVEALGQVDLEAGQVYRCLVNGYWIELRVLDPTLEPTCTPPEDQDFMLDPWVELPRPPVIASVVGYFGPPPPVHVPEIPEDGDYE